MSKASTVEEKPSACTSNAWRPTGSHQADHTISKATHRGAWQRPARPGPSIRDMCMGRDCS
ncbi:hypothetical protein [Archangium violaceum]|uniref:Uncharacterized protein n=1 Tax=Archangium violaceum Cb vi76 TaxID=1406225 RepID=A0A084SUS4_9BACT|nr:hypothetical protein [Archangium violaceum]KFA92209.1 hypothetical protein Q664_16865 [Archangium violaceum Cb vi76]